MFSVVLFFAHKHSACDYGEIWDPTAQRYILKPVVERLVLKVT